MSNQDVIQIVKQLVEGKYAKDLANAYDVSVVHPAKRSRKPKVQRLENKNVEAPIQKVKTLVKMEKYDFIIN